KGSAGRAQQTACPVERSGHQLEAEQALTLERTGHAQSPRLRGGEAEAAVIGRIADKDDRAVTLPACRAERTAHERRADPAVAAVGSDGDRAKQQGRLAGAADDVPKRGRSDDALAVHGNEGKSFGRRPAVAQPLRAFAPALAAESIIKQRFARR